MIETTLYTITGKTRVNYAFCMLLHQIRSEHHLCVLWATGGSLCEPDEAMCETCTLLLGVFMYCYWEPPAECRSVLEQETEPQTAHCPILSFPLWISNFLSFALLYSCLHSRSLLLTSVLQSSPFLSSHLFGSPLPAQSPERNVGTRFL